MVKKSNNWFELRNWEKTLKNVLNMIKIRFGKTMVEFNLKTRALISGGKSTFI